VRRAVDISGKPADLPPELTLRLLSEREPPTSGEALFAMDRYLRDRGDAIRKRLSAKLGLVAGP
jgi:hypothetical protein